MKKVEKKQNKKTKLSKFDEFIMKVGVERFNCNNRFFNFEFTKRVVKIAMDVWLNSRENVYKKKDS